METGTFHLFSAIGNLSDVIDSIGRYTLIILITCRALGNISSTNCEIKSAASSSKPISFQPSPVCLVWNRKQQIWQQERRRVSKKRDSYCDEFQLQNLTKQSWFQFFVCRWFYLHDFEERKKRIAENKYALFSRDLVLTMKQLVLLQEVMGFYVLFFFLLCIWIYCTFVFILS